MRIHDRRPALCLFCLLVVGGPPRCFAQPAEPRKQERPAGDADDYERGDRPTCCGRMLAIARCTGSETCSACSNCSYCEYCRGGLKCGVCAPAGYFSARKAAAEQRIAGRLVLMGAMTPRRGFTPEGTYKPEETDVVQLVDSARGWVAIMHNRNFFDDFQRLRRAGDIALGDEKAMDAIVSQGKGVKLPSGVKVKIHQMFPAELLETPTPFVGESIAPSLRVEILEGQHRGTAGYVIYNNAVWQDPRRKPAPIGTAADPIAEYGRQEEADGPAARQAKTNARAETLLKMAQGLEKAKKKPAAQEYYRQVVKQFPGTTQAKVAEERVKALAGKR